MISALIFDCFGVLYVDAGLTFYQSEIANFDELRTDILDIDKRCDYGFISEDEHDQQVAKLTGLDKDFISQNIRSEHALNQQLLDYSQSFRPKFQLGMLSNVGRGGMEAFFTEKQQAEYFDCVVLSSDVGMIKPSRDIFTHMAAEMGLKPEQCVMIDDRQENVDGARAAGMQAIRYDNFDKFRSELDEMLKANN